MKKKEYLDSILSDSEKLAVQMFVDNDLQREAVKKVLLAGLYNQGILEAGKKPNFLYNVAFATLNFDGANGASLKNEKVGENLRALFEGLQIVEEGFNDLTVYKTETETGLPPSNPAR